MNELDLIDKLVKAISFKFREDKTSPSLQISFLRKGYYASIVRYTLPIAKGKIVAYKTHAETLQKVLQNIASEFLKNEKTPKTPVDELSDFVANKANTNKHDVIYPYTGEFDDLIDNHDRY